MKQKFNAQCCPICQFPWYDCMCHPQWLARLGEKIHRGYLQLIRQSLKKETSHQLHVCD